MNELRHLLLDCRAALRRADRAFEEGPLRPRLDQTIIAMSTAAPPASKKIIAEPQGFSAQQVAFAWQQAARELSFTHPGVHAELGRAVRERLQDDELVDPGVEIIQVQQQLRDAQAGHAQALVELAALRQALAAAVALEGDEARGTPAELAQRRLAVLLGAANRGGGLPKPRPEDPDTIQPTLEELLQVSQGLRAFTNEEREWCVGEAMVSSNFEHDPAQLLEAGDRALAAVLLGGTTPGA